MKYIYSVEKLVEERAQGKNNQTECFNYIRFLQSYNHTHLYTCVTYAFQPKCTYVNADYFALNTGALEDGKGKCPYDPAKGHTGLIVDKELYSATLNNFLESQAGVLPPRRHVSFNNLRLSSHCQGRTGGGPLYGIFHAQWGDVDVSAVCQYQISDVKKVFEGSYKEYREASQRWGRYTGAVPVPRPGSKCLYAGSRSEVLQLPLANCSRYQSSARLSAAPGTPTALGTAVDLRPVDLHSG
ncbi:semaphorin-4C [Lates japonicus]|uniref:Semaphorin-4C n=1 Tax=Lates japonicus TaxID=270547 RepID=A0AAD3MFG8_LATJO|nr:semaphorin-4C [Lates japonicus]